MLSRPLILLLSVVCSGVLATPTATKIPILKHAGKVKENSYIIQLKSEASKSAHLSHLPKSGLDISYTYDQVFHGYAARLDSNTLEYIQQSNDVAAIFEDGITTTNMARPILKSDNTGPLSRSNPNLESIRRANPADVDVYDIGTGIYTAHTAFGGRAHWGATFGGYKDADGNGLSTCIAGIAVGATYGVATQANIYAVKAISDSGSAAISDLIAAINWVISAAAASGRPSLITLAISGSVNSALDTAVLSAINSRIHFIVPVPSSGIDPANTSPARVVAAIAVGIEGQQPSSIIDVCSKGTAVTCPSIQGPTATRMLSGSVVSMARVAGIVAAVIGAYGNSSPALIATQLKLHASKSNFNVCPVINDRWSDKRRQDQWCQVITSVHNVISRNSHIKPDFRSTHRCLAYLSTMLGALGSVILTLGLVSAAPTSPGECKPLSSLSFAHRPNVTSGLSTRVIFNGLKRPRGLRIDSLSNLLVVDRGVGVVALSYRNDSTCVGWEKRTVVNNENLNHGIEIGPSGGGSNQYLYASTSDNVLRWEYDPSSVAVVGNPVTIASNMSNSDHTTRTLILQPQSGSTSQYIIVTRGSESNLDEGAAEISSGRSQIRRFALNSSLPSGAGWAWEQGELLGWGLRNAVGIALSPDGEDLWEVENSSDNVFWRGVDVHHENPAEELNRIPLNNISTIPDAQKFYGYPWCYTAWDSSALTASSFTFQTGSQFSIRNPPETPDDAWCSVDQNNIKPVLSMQSHSAPLDIVFYNAPSEGSEGYDNARLYAVNTEWNGDAFVSFHGSWNRDPPTGKSIGIVSRLNMLKFLLGYKVVRIPWNNGAPAASADSRNGYETVVGAPDLSQCPNGCIRPVGVAFDRLGRLFVSSDTTGEIFIVENSNAPDGESDSSSLANRVNLAGLVMGVIGAIVVGLV
ncbi:pyrroloquinoline quinone binding, partial [Rhizoctonia solani]